jgi:hypothetical protein
MVQMERFLGDGGTEKRQYTAEPKSYSVVVKKPVKGKRDETTLPMEVTNDEDENDENKN